MKTNRLLKLNDYLEKTNTLVSEEFTYKCGKLAILSFLLSIPISMFTAIWAAIFIGITGHTKFIVLFIIFAWIPVGFFVAIPIAAFPSIASKFLRRIMDKIAEELIKDGFEQEIINLVKQYPNIEYRNLDDEKNKKCPNGHFFQKPHD